MTLDMNTMTIVGAFLAMSSGGLLIVARAQYRDSFAALWWVASDVVMAAGLLSLALGFEHKIIHPSSYVLLSFYPALIWVAARLSSRRSVSPVLFLAGPGAVAAAAMFAPVAPQVAGAVAHGIVGSIYMLAAAYTFIFRPRRPLLAARRPLAFFCALHGAVLAVVLLAFGSEAKLHPSELSALSQTGMDILVLETLVFLLGSTIFISAAMREDREQQMKLMAETDGLTGLLNRRAFLEKAERILRRCRHDGAPCSVVVFDLDHFKAINDTHGHAVGDLTLQIFAEGAHKAMRPNDIFGRIGGEEFAAILPGADLQAGTALAERIRKFFADTAREIDEIAVRGTVSAGTSSLAPGSEESVEGLLRRADEGLYRAKDSGRNRVVASEPETGPKDRPVLRIA